MIDKIKDFQEIIASRFNNIVVGSIVLSSIMMNARGILIFIYSDKDARLSILRNWRLDVLYDLIIPILIASFYIVVIPWVSALIKKHITNEIYKREQEAEREKILISLSGMQDVAVATVKSTTEYAEKFASNEMQTWLNEREQTLSYLQDVKAENILLKSNNEELTRSESSSSLSSTYNAMLYERCINSINNMGKSIQDINLMFAGEHFNKIENIIGSDENKNLIIQQLASAIRDVIEVNNNRPTSTLGDWQPPINPASTEALASLLTKLAAAKAENDYSMQKILDSVRLGGKN